MLTVGQPYVFRTNIGGNFKGPDGKPISATHNGRITYINRAHRFFLVEAPLGGGTVLRECFKF